MRPVVVVVAIVAEAGWVFVGADLLSEGAAQGPAPAFTTILASAGLAYCLATILSRLELDRRAVAAIGVGASVALVYAIARIEYAHDLALHDFQWFTDAVGTPGRGDAG